MEISKMSKLTYWKTRCKRGPDCLSHIFRTKRAAVAHWDLMVSYSDRGVTIDGSMDWQNYHPPCKVEVEYSGGAFGLMAKLTMGIKHEQKMEVSK